MLRWKTQNIWLQDEIKQKAKKNKQMFLSKNLNLTKYR